MSRLFAISALAVFAAPAPAAEPVEFRRDVIAALSRAGCNAGACHGSPQGKNGFRLSLRGGDAALDFASLARDQGSRRVDRVAPEDRLIPLKGPRRLRHQGGAVLGCDQPAYQAIARWVAEGCRDDTPSAAVRLEVLPGPRRLHTSSPRQQLAARAHYADGSVRDVTDLAVFTSSDPD